MNRNFILLLGALAIFLFSFKADSYIPNKATAEVEQIEGFYVFTDSRPIMPYDTLGRVEIGFLVVTEYCPTRNNLIQRARRKYKDGDGIFIHYSTKFLSLDYATVIKFK
ncbi:MAG: hypothetical protein JNL75_04275 [Chitinophagales bacterium]|nr:hypothetical protein [Chitinophagales bacterium]